MSAPIRFSSPGIDAPALLLGIVDDSARHNIGHIERNINIPTFPIVVLHPENQWPRRDRYVEGLAMYDSFRRFTTSVGAPHLAAPPR